MEHMFIFLFLWCCLTGFGISVIENNFLAVLQIASVVFCRVYHVIFSIMLHFYAYPREIVLFFVFFSLFNPQNQYIMCIVALKSNKGPFNHKYMYTIVFEN